MNKRKKIVRRYYKFFKPFSKVDKPVPPPIATIFGPLFYLLLTLNASTRNVSFSGTSAF